ncbi:MAG: YfcE family phosphodiesterase [Peptococcaceae bacterium]
MRIGVISDTHNDLLTAESALEKMGPVELLLHGGDHYQDALKLAPKYRIRTVAVRGNCDKLAGPDEEIIRINGHNILLTHGHQYGVKSGLERLYYRCKELKINIVIYGHTHVPSYIIEDNIHFLNPGSIGHPREGSSPSYAVVELGPEINITLQQIVK